MRGVRADLAVPARVVESLHPTVPLRATGCGARGSASALWRPVATALYPSGVAQFWDLLREFLLGDPVKGVRLAVLNAAVQVFIK